MGSRAWTQRIFDLQMRQQTHTDQLGSWTVGRGGEGAGRTDTDENTGWSERAPGCCSVRPRRSNTHGDTRGLSQCQIAVAVAHAAVCGQRSRHPITSPYDLRSRAMGLLGRRLGRTGRSRAEPTSPSSFFGSPGEERLIGASCGSSSYVGGRWRQRQRRTWEPPTEPPQGHVSRRRRGAYCCLSYESWC